ncbi:MAG: hypothetical protein WC527_08175 [Candidatus Margulisiibacteriota bacterium]
MVAEGYLVNIGTIILVNWVMLGIIVAIIFFIFLRRLLLFPIQIWQEKREKVYTRVLTDILKYTEKAARLTNKRFLCVRNTVDKIALEEILLKKMGTTHNEHLKQMLTKIYEDLGMVGWRVKQLKYMDSWSRKVAADSLGKSLSKLAIIPLTRISLRDRDEDVRFIATKSLGKLNYYRLKAIGSFRYCES